MPALDDDDLLEFAGSHRAVPAGVDQAEVVSPLEERAVRAEARAALLRRVIELGVLVGSEVELDAVLERIVEVACELTGARYGALGVLDPTRTGLERFVNRGLSEHERRRLGSLPRGMGVLGAVISDAQPLRLSELGADPRSVGFPAGHPPMRSFLGVPILIRGAPYGNLYLTEKRDGDFTDEDEEAVLLLASQAATAIQHSRMVTASRRWARQLEAIDEITLAFTTETELESLLGLISERLRELVSAQVVMIEMVEEGGCLRRVAAAGEGVDELVGTVARAETKAQRVLSRRHSERVDSTMDDPEIDASGAAVRLGIQAGMWLPLVASGDALGIVICGDKLGRDPRFSDDDLRIAEAFAQRAAFAVDRSRLVNRRTVQAIMQTQEAERGRLSRELHDQTGQALTSILLANGAVSKAETLEVARQRAMLVHDLAGEAMGEIRRIAVELRPPALDDFGLVAALRRLVESTTAGGIRVDVAATYPDETRMDPMVETAIYRVVQEAVSNAVKHANPSTISITMTHRGDQLLATVEDDGDGFSPQAVAPGRLGLVGMRERAAILGGDVTIESREGRGTTIHARIPTNSEPTPND